MATARSSRKMKMSKDKGNGLGSNKVKSWNPKSMKLHKHAGAGQKNVEPHTRKGAGQK
jgi:hypothetical protein